MATAATSEQALAERVHELTAQVDELSDPFARALADDLATAIVQLYGEGLERIFAVLGEPSVSVDEARQRLVDDGVVASLMLIHGLYPVDLETRVDEALAAVRPYLESHGGDIELLGIEDGVAKLRLRGSCDGCAASAATLESAVEQALRDAAPDLAGIDVEGAVPAMPPRPPASSPDWIELDGAAGIPRGTLSAVSSSLVVANVAGTLLAYRNSCAQCGNGIESGMLIGGTLTCCSCWRSYDLPRAGRSTDGDGPQLDPVPLLRSNGSVRVALAL